MCAGCFAHLLADARLKDESATCPNCRCELNKNVCSRNLAVEKAISELPSECQYCSEQLPRCGLAHHERELCQERCVCLVVPSPPVDSRDDNCARSCCDHRNARLKTTGECSLWFSLSRADAPCCGHSDPRPNYVSSFKRVFVHQRADHGDTPRLTGSVKVTSTLTKLCNKITSLMLTSLCFLAASDIFFHFSKVYFLPLCVKSLRALVSRCQYTRGNNAKGEEIPKERCCGSEITMHDVQKRLFYQTNGELHTMPSVT